MSPQFDGRSCQAMVDDYDELLLAAWALLGFIDQRLKHANALNEPKLLKAKVVVLGALHQQCCRDRINQQADTAHDSQRPDQ